MYVIVDVTNMSNGYFLLRYWYGGMHHNIAAIPTIVM